MIPAIPVTLIATITAEHYGQDLSLVMRSHRRSMPLTRCRHMAIWLSCRLTTLSTPEIGAHFGGRDHTTILAADRKIERLRQVDRAVATDCDYLLALIKQTYDGLVQHGVPTLSDPDPINVARYIVHHPRQALTVGLKSISDVAATLLSVVEERDNLSGDLTALRAQVDDVIGSYRGLLDAQYTAAESQRRAAFERAVLELWRAYQKPTVQEIAHV
jgi:hypothetical protein